jgi:type II secretory pathway predicted ATPase ExeA
MEHYGITKDFSRAGFFETTQHKTLFKQLRVSANEGVLIALTGLVGSGKTTMLRRLQAKLSETDQIIVSKSLALEKDKTTIATLISALFYDLSGDTNYKVPRQTEKRERELQDLTRKKTIHCALL